MKPVVIIGAGGCAREVLDIIDAINAEKPQYEILGFIVDPQYGTPGTLVNDKPILGGFDWLEHHSREVFVTCGVGPSHHRYRLVRRAQAAGCRFFSIIHPTARVTRWVQHGEGVIITAGCVLTNQIHIGNHVHLNLDCTISHDVAIEDFVTLAPGVHISGNVRLGEGCQIGTGANLIQKLRIGQWAIIGAGSTVIKDVPANTTVVGVPAKVIKEQDKGWHVR
jgi:sugar O-acyltransferase (sialic acid O-acetyltransferase NeuD family)